MAARVLVSRLGKKPLPCQPMLRLFGRKIQHHQPCLQTHLRKMTSDCLGPSVLSAIVAAGAALYLEKSAMIRPTGGPNMSGSCATNEDILIKQEKQRLIELLKSKEMKSDCYPSFTTAVEDGIISFSFKVPPACDVLHLIYHILSCVGLKDGDLIPEGQGHANNKDAAMLLRTSNRPGFKWRLCITSLRQLDRIFTVYISKPCTGSDQDVELNFMKEGSLTDNELDVIASALNFVGPPDVGEVVSALQDMGVKISGFNDTCARKDDMISWDNFAGYEQQKQEIEDTILLALQCPEVYHDIARGTRRRFETSLPRAVLFEGPPGTGKTSVARVIAEQAGVPMLYVPLEAIMSSYYGESERTLGTIFSCAKELPHGAIIFLDEVDSLAGSRDQMMYEGSRRLLTVLLSQIDGFVREERVIVIAATNRKQDLDSALINRFDSMISFNVPDQQTREKIAAQYAKHLNEPELVRFAMATEDMSGRDIRDVCQQAERRWAAKLIRGQAPKDIPGGKLPSIEEYIKSAKQRREEQNFHGHTKIWSDTWV